MATVDCEIREPVFRHRCRVVYADTDAGGVVYYAGYLRYFEEARTEFMRALGVSCRGLAEQGFILPVVECHARYKASAIYDDLLLIKTCLLGVTPRTCRFNYRVTREGDGKTLVQGYTTHAIVDRQGRLTRFPDEVLTVLVNVHRAPQIAAIGERLAGGFPCFATHPVNGDIVLLRQDSA